MIKSSRMTAGYAVALPAVKDRTFAFGPGLNVLFGPNGSGKSTVLRTTAAFVGCSDYGWTNPVQNYKKQPYPERFSEESPGRPRCQALVEWDGVPCYLQKTEVVVGAMLPSGGEDFDEALETIFVKRSSGQGVITQFNKMHARLAAPPDLTDFKRTWRIGGESIVFDRVNDVWQKYITSFVDYIKSIPAPDVRRVTLMIDEPDRSLSIPNQAVMWVDVLPRLAESVQIIVATHSPFALRVTGATMLEMVDGYIAECRECMEAR